MNFFPHLIYIIKILALVPAVCRISDSGGLSICPMRLLFLGRVGDLIGRRPCWRFPLENLDESNILR